MTTWTDPDRCSSCKYCGMDMDMSPFCWEPTVLEARPEGLNLNSAIQDFCGPELKLRVPQDPFRERIDQNSRVSDGS